MPWKWVWEGCLLAKLMVRVSGEYEALPSALIIVFNDALCAAPLTGGAG